MNLEKLRLPVGGTENFEKLRQEHLYYVDKTGLIKELFQHFSDVTIITRPRRFGKSLNMSMLRYFLEIGTDKSIFDGLAISRETALCEKHMGQYPVISISLKGVEGLDYESARRGMWSEIAFEANRFFDLIHSDRLNEIEKEKMYALCRQEGDLEGSLKLLSQLLYRHYGGAIICRANR